MSEQKELPPVQSDRLEKLLELVKGNFASTDLDSYSTDTLRQALQKLVDDLKEVIQRNEHYVGIIARRDNKEPGEIKSHWHWVPGLEVDRSRMLTKGEIDAMDAGRVKERIMAIVTAIGGVREANKRSARDIKHGLFDPEDTVMVKR